MVSMAFGFFGSGSKQTYAYLADIAPPLEARKGNIQEYQKNLQVYCSPPLRQVNKAVCPLPLFDFTYVPVAFPVGIQAKSIPLDSTSPGRSGGRARRRAAPSSCGAGLAASGCAR